MAWWQWARTTAVVTAVVAVSAGCGRSHRNQPVLHGMTGGTQGNDAGTTGRGGLGAAAGSGPDAGGAGGGAGYGAAGEGGGGAVPPDTAGLGGGGLGGQPAGMAGLAGGGTGSVVAGSGGAGAAAGAAVTCPRVSDDGGAPAWPECTTVHSDCDRHSHCFTVEDVDQCVCDAEFFGNGYTCDGPRLAFAVATSPVTTCAVIGSGKVRCWGDYGSGALGSGDLFHNIGDDEPASQGPIAPLDRPVTAVAAAERSTCVLFDDGDVRCWGYGDEGQLGSGTTNNAYTPATAPNVDLGGKAVALSGSGRHTCALLDTGGVRCWGAGYNGPVRDDGSFDVRTPAAAGDLDLPGRALQVAASPSTTCVVVNGGSVYCWGYFYFTPSEQNDLSDPGTPVDVGAKVKQVATSSDHVCVVTEDETVRCWGHNAYGQLGYGIGTTPVDLDSIDSAGDVNVGGPVKEVVVGDRHTCALLTSGSVRCWGFAGGFAYGARASLGDDETPADVGDAPLGGTVAHLTAAADHTCALMTDGTLRCFGANNFGELGYGSLDDVGDVTPPTCAGEVPLF
jgi:alpha-tubulin suppressor-like RCC1 family protein